MYYQFMYLQQFYIPSLRVLYMTNCDQRTSTFKRTPPSNHRESLVLGIAIPRTTRKGCLPEDRNSTHLFLYCDQVVKPPQSFVCVYYYWKMNLKSLLVTP